jgi:hypothetical protein
VRRVEMLAEVVSEACVFVLSEKADQSKRDPSSLILSMTAQNGSAEM